MSNLPYKLSEGIFLENTGVLIPWNASLMDLKKIGKPKIQKDADSLTLYWQKEHLWLGGLTTYFNTTFFDSKYALRLSNDKYTNHNLSLEFINFSTPDAGKSPRTEFERVKEHITNRLGQATADYKDKNLGLPLVEWHIQGILIVFMVFERFGEYCVGEVWHNPPSWRIAEHINN